jgi:hypothetical protein
MTRDGRFRPDDRDMTTNTAHSTDGTASAGAAIPFTTAPAPHALFAPGAVTTGAPHDFDFLFGDWDIANRRLRERWVGSAWEEFPAVSHVEPRLGGGANVDETHFPTKGFTGLTLRSFDHAARRWSITWINSTRGVLDPPVFGGFEGSRGLFYGEDLDDGVPVHVVFVWTRFDVDRARWEQAFSKDGATWETNWMMDLTRRR